MGSVDRADEKRFRVSDFKEDGEAKLQERVTNKLKEFMGNYTDDNLVKYVIVLLKNGRSKEEARKELDVFLGDDSHSFVAWLWDHLDTDFDLYMHPQVSNSDEGAKIRSTLGELGGKNDFSHMDIGKNDFSHMDIESEKGKPARSRHKREWKGLLSQAHDQPLLHISKDDDIFTKERNHHEVGRGRRSSSSPRSSPPQKKRNRHDEQPRKKREAVPQAVDAPRRLLQFAVRDAVGTLRPSGSGKEPASKRLRSVVSTSTEDKTMIEEPRRLRSIARVANPMATVVKAVQEAAEDVMKVKSAGSVFDRLGRDMDTSETDRNMMGLRGIAVEDEEYVNVDQVQEQPHVPFIQRTDYDGLTRQRVMRERETGVVSALIYGNDGYNDTSVMGNRVVDVPQTGISSGNKGEDFLMEYGMSKDEDQHISVANTARKINNVPANVNTWKLPHHIQGRNAALVDNLKSAVDDESAIGNSVTGQRKENRNPVSAGTANAISADTKTKSQRPLPSIPGSYTAARPLEDAESRSIFVSNVHFGATLDSLSRHFNKFGEVLKVVIVTDPATGQPVGSAYVEFTRKEAADNALSLDGTSFMSRILKVVKKSNYNQDSNPAMAWPRVTRGTPYTVPRFSRAPFPRSIGSGFRSRPHLIQGARSLQWKRDAQAMMAEGGGASSGKSLVSPIARSLTYVRTEPKPDGNSGTS